MKHGLELWNVVAERLRKDNALVLLIVAKSSGSSPGRAGYKMAITPEGEMHGSIGGGVMEVELVEAAKSKVQCPKSKVIEQVHRRDVENASGMICSGRQTVIVEQLTSDDLETVERIIEHIKSRRSAAFEISNLGFRIVENTTNGGRTLFTRTDEAFVYQEMLDQRDELIIIGGGHCALALSELAVRLNFRIRILDDRPELNTIAKNEFADGVTIIESYENVGEHISSSDAFVVVMTLGFASDKVVIRELVDREFKYFGVLGSKAKMATLLKELRDKGFDEAKLSRIRTPIGLPINSRTPDEIAVSIAAEMIQVRNAELKD